MLFATMALRGELAMAMPKYCWMRTGHVVSGIIYAAIQHVIVKPHYATTRQGCHVVGGRRRSVYVISLFIGALAMAVIMRMGRDYWPHGIDVNALG